MTTTHTIILQAILGALQMLNLVTSVVPDKWKPVVLGALALGQILQAKLAHKWNPDGTPASVAYKASGIFLLCILLSSAVMAQAAPIQPPIQHFTLSGSVVSYMGPGGASPASIADAYFNLTQHFSVGYQQITIPTIATAKLGVIDYGKLSCAWFGKTFSAKLVFDCSKVSIDVFGGAGKLNESTLNVNRIAETLGACVSYSLGANVSANLVCGQWLHGGIVNGFVTNGQLPGTVAQAPNSSSAAVSSGIKVHF